jgi:hypothetical protein
VCKTASSQELPLLITVNDNISSSTKDTQQESDDDIHEGLIIPNLKTTTEVLQTAASSRPSRSEYARRRPTKSTLLAEVTKDPVSQDESTHAFISQNIQAFAAKLCHDPQEPLTYEQAINGPDSLRWINAMKQEIETIIKNRTWLEQKPPRDAHILKGKWVYKIKRNADRSINKYKARWVFALALLFHLSHNFSFLPMPSLSGVTN